MEVTIIKHGEQVFGKTEQGELLKVNGIVIPHSEGAPSFIDSGHYWYKLICAEGTKHHAKYVSAGMINLYPNEEREIIVPVTD